MLRHVFLDEGARDLYPDWDAVAAETVAFLRLSAGAGPRRRAARRADRRALACTARPSAACGRGTTCKSKCFGVKRFEHPQVGPLELDYESLKLPDADQMLVTYTAAPGSPSETALRLLAHAMP